VVGGSRREEREEGEEEMTSKWWILAVAALGLTACDGLLGSDDDDIEDIGGLVFTMNNAAAANHVIIFTRNENGTLARQDSLATDGRGSGPHPVFGTDPLESQDALILSDDERFLFVVNAGSNEVTSFRLGSGTLTRVSRVSSGGAFPVSLAHRGNVLYVVNANNGGNISGFRVGADGALTPLANSTRPLSGAAMPAPGSIRISPNGQTLVVTEKATNNLVIYPLDTNGIPGTRAVVPAPGPTPFGADFDAAGRYILSEGNVGPMRAAVPDGSTVSSATLTGTGISVITDSAPTTETAACWIQITRDGRFAYTTNTGSGSITGFSISGSGALTRLTADGKTGVTGMGTQPLDMAFADKFLYALTPGDGGIHVFRVESNGALTPLANITNQLPISATGLAAL
jgi:6-phosphogluconolactonase (cycloisomerase 2 family)